MEHDVVLTDEVYQTGVLVLPPFLPVAPFLRLAVAELLGIADVTDGGVEPNIEHLAVGSLNRNGNTPIQVAGHSTGLQIHIEPRLALSVNVGAPLLVLLQNPLLQPVLIIVQGQIPVLGLLQHWGRA